MTAPVLSPLILKSVGLSIAGQPLIRDLSLSLTPGHLYAIIGPNGTGKTSLMRALTGEIPLDSGHVSLGEATLGRSHRTDWHDLFSYMPQDNTADIAMTVLEVVVMGRLKALDLHIDDDTLHQALHRLDATGILPLADRLIGTLSGGQRQMAFFAQTLMRDPRVMLLDEPVSALDLSHQLALLDHLADQTRRHQWISVVILHDLNLAAQYADALIVLGGGGLKAFGPPAQILTPALIADTYGVEADVLSDRHGRPLVQPLRRRSA
ncbi:ABC transporter ATP-binding protein [Novispirillum itersonii]|uniref:Iron complex transport system ATP-binding protein n=1 Tax=Novispirillum itersonii TaxID=189 RepID=A0A7W9ZCE0_NOVIT|nr:ABC transporter ATP-binding protein [Novispirillum itersonii]MBB6208836.1 iron complex transport system ATP-binding protein [Novispirillum itersonii]